MSVNKVILVGNLGNDPEFRAMPSGSGVSNFSVATSKKWKDKRAGEVKEKTEWTNCKAFDRGNYKMAEYIAQGCKKGTKIYVEGELETEEYEKDGVKRYATKVNVLSFEILSGGIPKDDQAQQGQPSGNSRQSPPQQQGFNQPAPQPQSFGSFNQAPAQQGDPWATYTPTAATNGATIEQVKQKYNGDLQAAIANGHVEKNNQAARFDFNDDIPFK